MGEVLNTPGVSEASLNANLHLVYWEGEELACDKLPRMSLVWKILWELYELNFCIELSGLDQCASTEPMDPVSRIQWLQACFPDSDFLLWNSLLSYLILSYQPCLSYLIK